MADIWTALETRTRGWSALARQALGDAVWQDHVLARFAGRADPRALPLLYPYLRSPDRATRLRAMATATRVFSGGGSAALEHLGWFTANPDHFIQDRAVQVVAAAMRGSPPAEALGVLRLYLTHRNHFVRRQAILPTARALRGSRLPEAVAELERSCVTMGDTLPPEAIALLFTGHPDLSIWTRVVDHPPAVGILVHGAGLPWFERAVVDCFAPAMADIHGFFRQREAVVSLSYGGAGLGMVALRPALASAGTRHTGHALVATAMQLFDGADEAIERGPLVELVRGAPTPVRRVAAVCLGRLLLASGDTPAIAVLCTGTEARDGAVRAAMLDGLGLVARSSRDRELMARCARLLRDPHSAVAAIRAIGLIAWGTGDRAADELIRSELAWHRAQPVIGKGHNRAWAACLAALGLIHLGTGNLDPLEPLLETLVLPDAGPNRVYRRAAAKALVHIEHGEAALQHAGIDPDGLYDAHWNEQGLWPGILSSREP